MQKMLVLSCAVLAVAGCKTKSVEPAPDKPAAQTADEAKPATPQGEVTDLPAPPDVAAAPADAVKTESGLASKVLTKGTGAANPTPNDIVRVHYTGWTTDGKMFDSSVKRGKPAEFPLGRVIPGWTEGVQLMVEGEKRRFWIPGKLAYGEKKEGAQSPHGFGPPMGTLVFDVELLSFEKGPEPPEVPKDVGAVPANAKKTKSGLASRLLKKGSGKAKPKATDQVKVNYTGWTTDGKMFDSSITRGKPATFPLNRVIPGWTEGLQLMTVGEKRRFWIPGKLAYGEKKKEQPSRPGPPLGMLVFDVELLEILK